ncbi:excinuclease ABC subunit C [Helicobacter muridarum]|uniref:Excinuclease ABC subunit C n=1 Tax=Helicobacter muridarum TaxID=216 RepID=A0A099TY76_9HELI|nr:excinuclease ABC subunit UvrC [Helicobacter muridarum]TLD98899.1 excinuclease ABC subunit C [Helicobacter muridarum]STQ87136.1 excinuclease ABC subunit C [Helicobacter muridarum]
MNLTLLEQLKSLPQRSGIYQYYDKYNRLLYVGKAKNLKKRVMSYFAKDLSPNPRNSMRIRHMVSQICSLQIFVVENERDALILENSLIKSQNPKYNILLRDDKTYPYICIDKDSKYPRFVITRRIEDKKGMLYFGPYPRGAKEILNSLYMMFPLVQQASCLKGKRVCLYYQIQRCLGICEFASHELQAKYADIISQAIKLMQNKNLMKQELQRHMLDSANKELFEHARFFRDCISVIDDINFCAFDLKKHYDCDVLSFVMKGGQGVLLKLFVRNGKVDSMYHIFVKISRHILASNPKSYNERTNESSSEFELEIYTQALLKISQDKTLAKELIIANITESNFILLQKLAKEGLQDCIPKLVMPKRGAKLELAKIANDNAIRLLHDKETFFVSENETIASIAELFLLDREIASIEVFDTSHHAGSFCVGAMISYSDNDFCKEKYRHYNLSGRDEYSQMREMLTRRALSFDSLSPPDLWVLDGGKAQIAIALEILESSNVNIDVIAIAKEKRNAKAYRSKGGAKDIIRSRDLEFKLDSNDLRLQFLQKLRDEAHRFAITFHRSKKTNSIGQQKL